MRAEYIKHLKEKIGKADFSGLKIGLDCANGATGVVAKDVFEDFGASISVINDDANYGRKINENAGSTHIEGLKSLVLEKGLDFGAAFDGDGDRCLLIDDGNGEEVDGDQILAILADYFGLDKIVSTVMANQGLLDWGKQAGVEVQTADVGDQNVFRAMNEEGILLGGEQSGHIILPGEAMGDGILTALTVSKVITENKKSLSELAKKMKKFPQATINVPVSKREKENFEEMRGLVPEISGRFLARASGTEDIIRVTVWGKKKEETEDFAEELARKIKEEIKNGN